MAFTHINQILEVFEQDKAISDIHLASNEYIAYRKVWWIHFVKDHPKFDHDTMAMIIEQLLESHPGGMERLEKNREIDFNFFSKQWVPYRVNAFYKLENIGVAMRKIASKPMALSKLMYDDVAEAVKKNVLNQKTGLFLVTWPTGSWKSTSLVAMLQWLNENRNEHIVTIEDPIEYIFEPASCLISQRELGSDTLSFAWAMKAAMRQDPDIIFVWEIRDRETAEAALNLAETWHLVFSTLHTRSASNTVSRMVSLFPPDIQENVKDRMSTSLLGIQSQFLLKTVDGKSRVWLYELMINTTAIRNDIRKNEWKLINSIIETSRQAGMISHAEYAKRLLSEDRITKESVDWLFG